MRRSILAALIAPGIAVAALAGCSSSGNPPANIHIQQNNGPSSSAPAPPASPDAPPANPAAPNSGGFLVPSALEQSVASEQAQALSAAPASDYDSTDSAPVSVSCQSTGTDTFTCTGSDTDGDTGSADNVTVAPDGSSWSDSGMTWSGPDVGPAGGYTVDSVTGWTSN
jgi:hypothetical protein